MWPIETNYYNTVDEDIDYKLRDKFKLFIGRWFIYVILRRLGEGVRGPKNKLVSY